MAKYDVTYSCGHNGTVELFGKTSERENKLNWYAAYGLCPACYRAKMESAEAEKVITIHVSATAEIDRNGDPLLCVWLDGNTRPAKDDIKACGYRWSERRVADDALTVSTKMCWNKLVTAEKLDEAVEAIKALGGVATNEDWSALDRIAAAMASDASKAYKAKKDAIAAIAKPAMPEILRERHWNGRIYGKAGRYNIYLDGNKVELTDDAAEEIKKYAAEKEEYDRKVAAIK